MIFRQSASLSTVPAGGMTTLRSIPHPNPSEPHHTILRIVLHTPRIYTRTKQLDPIRSNDKVRLGPAPTTTQRPKSGSWTGVPVRSCGPQRFGDASHARQATISSLLCCFFSACFLRRQSRAPADFSCSIFARLPWHAGVLSCSPAIVPADAGPVCVALYVLLQLVLEICSSVYPVRSGL
jgi:hypothetical protein